MNKAMIASAAMAALCFASAACAEVTGYSWAPVETTFTASGPMSFQIVGVNGAGPVYNCAVTISAVTGAYGYAAVLSTAFANTIDGSCPNVSTGHTQNIRLDPVALTAATFSDLFIRLDGRKDVTQHCNQFLGAEIVSIPGQPTVLTNTNPAGSKMSARSGICYVKFNLTFDNGVIVQSTPGQ